MLYLESLGNATMWVQIIRCLLLGPFIGSLYLPSTHPYLLTQATKIHTHAHKL